MKTSYLLTGIDQRFAWVEQALEELKHKASHGLKETIKDFRRVERQLRLGATSVSYDITIGNIQITLWFQDPETIRNRAMLRRLLKDKFKPVVLVHKEAKRETIKNRVVKGILLVINRLRRKTTEIIHTLKCKEGYQRRQFIPCNC